nr:hypothetical protein DGKKSRWO_DGKKSRWO_CDS_0066 [uncultured phage]CAI9752230.1 hypothetical protein CVNMHQAP_CVNMHQAP_CDS_0066 [uncultured phage]
MGFSNGRRFASDQQILNCLSCSVSYLFNRNNQRLLKDTLSDYIITTKSI